MEPFRADACSLDPQERLFRRSRSTSSDLHDPVLQLHKVRLTQSRGRAAALPSSPLLSFFATAAPGHPSHLLTIEMRNHSCHRTFLDPKLTQRRKEQAAQQQ